MTTRIEDLTEYMFSSLERLDNKTLSDEELQKEATRAKAIVETGKIVIDIAKISLEAAKLQADYLGNQAALPPIFQPTGVDKK